MAKKRVRPNTKKMLADGTAGVPKLSQMMEIVSEMQRDGTDTFDVGECSAEFSMILAAAIESAREKSSATIDEVRALHHLPTGISCIRQHLRDRLQQCEVLLTSTSHSDSASRRKTPRLQPPKQIFNKRYKEILQRPLSSVSARKRPLLALLKQLVQLDQMLMCLEGTQTGKREVADSAIDWSAFLSTGISYGIAIGWAAAELRHGSAISEAAKERKKRATGGNNGSYRVKFPDLVERLVADALRRRYQSGLSWNTAFEMAGVEFSTAKAGRTLPSPSRIRSFFIDDAASIISEIESAPRVNRESTNESCRRIAARMSTDELSVKPEWVQSLYADWQQGRLPDQKSTLLDQLATRKLTKKSLAMLKQMEEHNIMASRDLLRIALLVSTKDSN
jgi:hypothetical protein